MGLFFPTVSLSVLYVSPQLAHLPIILVACKFLHLLIDTSYGTTSGAASLEDQLPSWSPSCNSVQLVDEHTLNPILWFCKSWPHCWGHI